MKEIQEVVNKQVESMIASGAIQEIIQEGVKNSIKKAIDRQFESYGSITKELEKAIEKGLMINFSDIPFESYNEQMLVAVKAKLGGLFAEQASSRFLSQIDSLLEPAPSEITLKKLVEKVAASWKTDEPWDASDLDDDATVEIEPWRHGSNDYSLKMWKQKESRYGSSHQPDIELFISNNKIRISHKQSYNPTCFSEHESFIFKLYSAGTTITEVEGFDPDDCDLTLKDNEY